MKELARYAVYFKDSSGKENKRILRIYHPINFFKNQHFTFEEKRYLIEDVNTIIRAPTKLSKEGDLVDIVRVDIYCREDKMNKKDS